MRTINHLIGLGLGLALVAGVVPVPVAAQGSGSHQIVFAGYGTVTYGSRVTGPFTHDFTASLSPIALVALGNDILVESEFEVELVGGGTEIALEYAQINYLGFEHVQFTAGKFLLPFGVFGERLHPSWINKLPTMPIVYGHAHGGVAEGSLLPVLSDIGIMTRIGLPVGLAGSVNFALWVTQGPQIVTAGAAAADDGHTDHTHALAAPFPQFNAASAQAAAQIGQIPDIAYGTAVSDNNSNKMLGGRIGFVQGGQFELYAAGFHARYDAASNLDIMAGNVAAEWRMAGLELRGEGAVLWQEYQDTTAVTPTFPTLVSPAYYLQVARRFGSVEPVVRWGHMLNATVDGAVMRRRVREVALGVNYWLSQSVPLKLAYVWSPDGGERLITQWAFGF